MKYRNNLHITTIYGNSVSGKTTLAKNISNKKDSLYIDMYTILQDYNAFNGIDNNVINNGKPEILFDKLSYADSRVKELTLVDVEGDSVIMAILDSGEIVQLNKVSRKYQMLLNLILLIRNKKNLVIDNLDILNIGSNTSAIYKLLIKEIETRKNNVTLTFTDITLWQLFSLKIPKEVRKKFIMCARTNEGFEHMEIDYLKLAYTVNFLYDKSLKVAIEEDRNLRPSDIYEN